MCEILEKRQVDFIAFFDVFVSFQVYGKARYHSVRANFLEVFHSFLILSTKGIILHEISSKAPKRERLVIFLIMSQKKKTNPSTLWISKNLDAAFYATVIIIKFSDTIVNRSPKIFVLFNFSDILYSADLL